MHLYVCIQELSKWAEFNSELEKFKDQAIKAEIQVSQSISGFVCADAFTSYNHFRLSFVVCKNDCCKFLVGTVDRKTEKNIYQYIYVVYVYKASSAM